MSPRERALELVETRNALRTHARDLMADSDSAMRLAAREPNKTIEDLVAAGMAKGLRGDDLWNAIAESSYRSRASALGLEP